MDKETRSKYEIRQSVLTDLKHLGPGNAFSSSTYPLAEHGTILEVLIELQNRGWILGVRWLTRHPRVKYPMTFGLTDAGVAALSTK